MQLHGIAKVLAIVQQKSYTTFMALFQKEIAEKLNLSPATVSRSLRQDPRIPQETRSKVVAMASQMGYRSKKDLKLPNVFGKSNFLNSNLGTPTTLAIFVQSDDSRSSENAFQTMTGMGMAAQKHHVSLVFHTVPLPHRNEIHLPENQPQAFRAGKVDGVILLNRFGKDSVDQLLKQTTCIGISTIYSGLNIDCVGEENIDGMGKIVNHLYVLGHRKVAYMDENYDASFLRERVGGYVSGMLRHGLTIKPEHILCNTQRVDGQDESGFEILARWMDDGVTAIVCANDHVAIAVTRWLKRNGISIPQQVSVTGFDGTSVPADVPTLTTVRVNFKDIGQLAVERLLQRLKDPFMSQTRFNVLCELVEGKSTEPVPVA